ncbi:MAG: hypothetical protein MUP98_11210 [Candidatus Aminicenantes bacterium]|nr:hypothetical protein [Candidatus Aminicenantes bacterium]
MKSIVFNFQGFQDRIKKRLSLWQREDFVGRLQAKDPTLWFPSPQEGISDRLGWLKLPENMSEKLEDFNSFREDVRGEQYSPIVLCGMGGSSLSAEIFQKIFGNAPGHPKLVVLDSTHPAAVKDVEKRISHKKPLFIISSKSGTTIETMSLSYYFWDLIGSLTQTPGQHFVAITDPGTPLEKLALQRKFRKVFYAPADVGGRYSALSEFGLLPASVIGMDVRRFLEQAKFAAENCNGEDEAEEKASCLYLGAFLGELHPTRDKLTILTSASLRGFSGWLEQLVAESIGKNGQGIVPIINEPQIPPENYGDDRYFAAFFLETDENGDLDNDMECIERLGHPTIRIYLKDIYGLAQEIFRWEVAVALAGAIIGIHPFNQPDVQLTKDLTRKVLEMDGEIRKKEGELETFRMNDGLLAEKFESWISSGKTGDYLCIQAFLPFFPEIDEAVQKLRMRLLKRTHLASTFGFGPRYLHSTGQLHKGGPNSGLFLQLVDEPEFDLQVPETDYSFGSLIQAQALGDFQSLKEKNRRVLKINLGTNVLDSLRQLEENVETRPLN